MSDAEGVHSNDLRVLVLLRDSRDAGAVPGILERIGVASVVCHSSEEISAEIKRGAGAILTEEEVLAPPTKDFLVDMLGRQPAWSELPVIVLLGRGPETLAAREALRMPGDVTLVERPVRVITLTAIVRSALRSRSRQYLVRDQLRALDKSESNLKKANDELELRVEERTRELKLALEQLRSETKERLLAVEELRLKDQLLMQQSRMAAMGEMIGFIAHQWRQPLNALGLIAQELSFRYQRGLFDAEIMDSATSETTRIIRHMSQTLDDFRNFFKPETRKVMFRVIETVGNTLKLVEASFREINLKIEVKAEDDLVAEGYPNQFSQVLLNLLMNARDACVERKVEQPRVAIRLFMADDKAVITIADNAGGIPETLMERIFEPYFTTKGPDRGTGIGLYMAKTIIENNMGGRLAVSNGPEGAEFRIEF